SSDGVVRRGDARRERTQILRLLPRSTQEFGERNSNGASRSAGEQLTSEQSCGNDDAVWSLWGPRRGRFFGAPLSLCLIGGDGPVHCCCALPRRATARTSQHSGAVDQGGSRRRPCGGAADAARCGGGIARRSRA